MGIVDDVVVGEGGRFGRACGATGELDVDRIVELQDRPELVEPLSCSLVRGDPDVGEVQQTRAALLAKADDEFEIRKLGRAQVTGCGLGQLRDQRLQHLNVVAALERRCGDQGRTADLVERVLQFGKPVRWIDVHQDQAGLRGRELGDDPLPSVGCPDADALTRLEPERETTGGDRVDLSL